MTEVERENVLFERDIVRQRKRERWELHKKLQKEKKKPRKAIIAASPKDWTRDTKIVDLEESEEDYPHSFKSSEKKNFISKIPVEDTVELENVISIILSRSQIEQWLYRSFFQTDLIGFFVRLSLGIDPTNGQQVYRLCQIDSVIEYYRTYTVNNSVTKFAFNLRIGKAVKKFTIDSISNSPPSQKEFGRWLMELRHANCYIMRRREATALVDRLKYLQETPVTEKEIDYIVKEKRKLNVLKRNPAAEKAFLNKEREFALQTGKMDEVERIDASLAIVNRKLSEASAVGNARSDSMAVIFERNRRINQASAEADIERKKSINSSIDDSLNPFARRKTISSLANIVSSTTYKEDTEKNEADLLKQKAPFLSSNAFPLISTPEKPIFLATSSVLPEKSKGSVSLDDLEIEIPGFK